ncbi:FecR domain-containing protein [candidate division TA06 bacterium]|uniref:FecR domain-containing protein n=1 Tax=candidate division TA06 bacterium TaxID=2250710 RepID=A0A933ICJ0_UNCT6|nr:FecR domain-containing protein [candidate division TA06 bacterium]
MMINKSYKKTISLAVVILQLLGLAAPALAEYKPAWAKINYLKGRVEVQKAQGIIWAKAAVKMKLGAGDKISTEDGSEAEIVLEDGSVLKMKDKSLLLIERMEKSKKPTISVVNSFKVRTGKVLGCVRKLSSLDSKFIVETPTAVAGIRGTVFAIYVEGDSTGLDVLMGEVGIRGDSGEEIMVGEKMTTTVARGDSAKAPVAMTAAKIAFITLWAGAAIKLGSLGAATATAWYASTAAVVTGASVVVAGIVALIIAGGGNEGSKPTPAKTIPGPPGWPQ